MNVRNRLLLAGILASVGGIATYALDQKKKSSKPEFTEEELEHIRSLPKKERKRAVVELRTKYAIMKRGSNGQE